MNERATIAHQPALDGVRAIAVIWVVLFHAGVPGFAGGYLGVSVFFTISGYLITTLLLSEHDLTGRIDLAHFYARRVGRLLPASALCVGAIVVLASTTEVFAGVTDLRRQVVGSVLQVANWVFLAGEGSYRDLFEGAGGVRSPLEHFWSLAIEEQFYWLWPPAMLFVLRVSRSQRSRVLWVGGFTAACAVAAPLTAAVWGPDAAYWATPARISEILVGAWLAVAVSGRSLPDRVGGLAPAALATLAGCVLVFPASGGPAYEGWLPLVAVASAALVLGLQVDGPVRRLLSTGPLVRLGRISYGVYLFHWPVFLVADDTRTGLDGPILLLVQLATTLLLAEASSALLEQPIRRSVAAIHRPGTVVALASVASVAVAGAALLHVPVASPTYWLADERASAAAAIDVTDGADVPVALLAMPDPVESAQLARIAASPEPQPADHAAPSTSTSTTEVDPSVGDTIAATSTSTTVDPPVLAPSRPVRIVVAGDSTANATGSGLVSWAVAHPDLAQVEIVAAPGCGFLVGGEWWVGEWRDVPAGCAEWARTFLTERVAELRPDVVMLMVTSWDLLDRRWDGETALTPLDADYARRLEVDYAAVTESLVAAGAGRVAWVRAPLPNVLWMEDVGPEEDPVRHEVVRAIYDALAARSPDRVVVIELDDWSTSQGYDTDRDARPDGVHWERAAAVDIAERYLGERLVRVATS